MKREIEISFIAAISDSNYIFIINIPCEILLVLRPYCCDYQGAFPPRDWGIATADRSRTYDILNMS